MLARVPSIRRDRRTTLVRKTIGCNTARQVEGTPRRYASLWRSESHFGCFSFGLISCTSTFRQRSRQILVRSAGGFTLLVLPSDINGKEESIKSLMIQLLTIMRQSDVYVEKCDGYSQRNL